MIVIKLACPECEAHLTSARPLPAGRRIQCPECRAYFLVPLAARRQPVRNRALARVVSATLSARMKT